MLTCKITVTRIPQTSRLQQISLVLSQQEASRFMGLPCIQNIFDEDVRSSALTLDAGTMMVNCMSDQDQMHITARQRTLSVFTFGS